MFCNHFSENSECRNNFENSKFSEKWFEPRATVHARGN